MQQAVKNIKSFLLVILTLVFVAVVLVPSDVLLQKNTSKEHVGSKNKEDNSKKTEITDADSPSLPSGEAPEFSWDPVEFISNIVIQFLEINHSKESHIFVKQIKLSSFLAHFISPNGP